MKVQYKRWLSGAEREKRGCTYCLDVIKSGKYMCCPYRICPYKQLNKFKSYREFMKQTESEYSLDQHI